MKKKIQEIMIKFKPIKIKKKDMMKYYMKCLNKN